MVKGIFLYNIMGTIAEVANRNLKKMIFDLSPKFPRTLALVQEIPHAIIARMRMA
jgi:hypothetical protein